jgi:hypothetical protein
MMINVMVTCQYYENYNVGPDGFGEVPYWKPKGGHTFMMPFDSDSLYFGEDALIKGIKTLLETQSNLACRFEYIDHDILWEQPQVVNGLDEVVESAYKVLELVEN